MPRQCSACAADVEAINVALANGDSPGAVAERFGLSRSSVRRHKEQHFDLSIMKQAFADDPASTPETLIERLHLLTAEADRIKTRAERAGDLRLALAGIRELAGLVELTAKLRGQFPAEQQVNIAVVPEWQVVLNALNSYPEARLAVVHALDAA
jgi:hypothetical protein